MTTLKITARGQVTFRPDVLQHLSLQPGDHIRLDLLPGGRAELKADRSKEPWRKLHGMLKGKGNGARLSIADIDDATVEAGAAAALTGFGAT